MAYLIESVNTMLALAALKQGRSAKIISGSNLTAFENCYKILACPKRFSEQQNKKATARRVPRVAFRLKPASFY
jgi:hypothetical protein